MSEKKTLPRRTFIQISTRIAFWAAGLLGLGGVIRYFSHLPNNSGSREYDLGPAADFPEIGKLVRIDIPAAIYQTGSEYKAFSLVCTHLGCNLDETGDTFSCPCHGSEFAQDSRVIKGPAVDALLPMVVEQNQNGNLILRTKGALR